MTLDGIHNWSAEYRKRVAQEIETAHTCMCIYIYVLINNEELDRNICLIYIYTYICSKWLTCIYIYTHNIYILFVYTAICLACRIYVYIYTHDVILKMWFYHNHFYICEPHIQIKRITYYVYIYTHIPFIHNSPAQDEELGTLDVDIAKDRQELLKSSSCGYRIETAKGNKYCRTVTERDDTR